MKVVLDTNVLVSGMFWTGPSNQNLQAWISGSLVLMYTEEILNEYTNVVERYQDLYTRVDGRAVLRLVGFSGHRVDSLPLEKQVCADPDDDKFNACALAAKCRVIISGDRHLLDVDGYESFKVMNPRSFVDKFLSH